MTEPSLFVLRNSFRIILQSLSTSTLVRGDFARVYEDADTRLATVSSISDLVDLINLLDHGLFKHTKYGYDAQAFSILLMGLRKQIDSLNVLTV